jgi:hypothetical protein
MKTFFVLVALIFGLFGVCAQEWDACGVCSSVVQTLEGFLNQHTTEEELMRELAAISAQVCANVPEKLATKEQCNSYVSLYGPYTIELLLSESNPKSICSTMGMCTDVNNHYKLVFPSIGDNSINYLFTEGNIVADSLFNYKMFLANPAFLDSNDYEFDVQMRPVSGCDLTLKITNKTNYVQTEICKQDIGCNLIVPKPGRGVWYYVTIAAKLHAPKASFTFSATEKNSTRGHWILKEEHHRFSMGRFALIMCLTFSSVCLGCVCISRCVHRRKIIKRRNIQQQTEPIFIGVMPEMVVSIDEERPTMYPHMPVVFPFAPNQNYIQMQQLEQQ